MVTEVGRQPWILYGVMRVAESGTPVSGAWATFIVIAAVYLLVGIATVLVLRGMVRRWRATEGDATDVPYGPHEELVPQPADAAS